MLKILGLVNHDTQANVTLCAKCRKFSNELVNVVTEDGQHLAYDLDCLTKISGMTRAEILNKSNEFKNEAILLFKKWNKID